MSHSGRGPRPHKRRKPKDQGNTNAPRFIGTCHDTGKRAYLDRPTAKKAIRVMGTGNHLAAYRCDFCGHWHVGHHRNGATREFYRQVNARVLQSQEGT